MTSTIVDQFVANSPWKHVPAKRLFTTRKDVNVGLRETNRLALTMGGVINRALDDAEGLQSSDYSVYQLFDEGDLVFKLIDLENIKTSRVGWVHERGIMSPAYIRLVKQTPAVNTRFYYWYFYALYLNNIFNGLGGGIRQNLTPKELLEVSVPELDERLQTAIDNYLDRETARIDNLIAEKQNFINLLKEKRQALISHVVTKGLDPKVKLKESGIEWIGEVPEHWSVAAMKRFWSVLDCKHITAEFVESGVPLASIREVQSRFVDLSNAKRTTDEFYEQLIDGGRKPQAGDIIYSRNATVGEAAMVPDSHERFAMGQDVCLLRKNGEGDSRYLYYQLHSTSVKDQLEVLMVGATFRRINVDNIRNFVVLMPPPQEQAQIANFLDAQSAKYDQLVGETSRSIDLLREHRTALISAAVTGKIDVRDQQ